MSKDSNTSKSKRSTEQPVANSDEPSGDDSTRVFTPQQLQSADYPIVDEHIVPPPVTPLTNYGPTATHLPPPDPTVRIKAPYRATDEEEKWQAVRDHADPTIEPEAEPTEEELRIRQQILEEQEQQRRIERAAAREATRRAKRRTRWRQVVVLGVLVGLLAVGAIVAALGLTGAVRIPGIGPAPAGPLACPAADFKGADPADIEVNIYNASGISGAAGKVSTELGARGISVASAKNDPMNKTYPENAAVIRFGPEALPEAWTMLTMFPLGALEYTSLKGNSKVVDVVLGSKYTALTPMEVAQPLFQGPIPPYVEVPNCVAK
ncbi:LytR C-terminal domain-containing protein [Micrococcales bacterium 31B]|nr:LytR C-terminal domain-containing protein [Micrococcales bacterium 31B]